LLFIHGDRIGWPEGCGHAAARIQLFGWPHWYYPFMHRTLTDRNQAVPDEPAYSITEVLRLKSEGLTHSQIADRFGISSTRVWQFVKHERERVFSEGRAVTIRREISAGNDLDRKLPLADLFCVLNLSKRAETVLRGHLTQQDVTEFSLRDMMDFLIPAIETPKDRYDLMPAYKVKMLGQILYAAMIKGLAAEIIMIDADEARELHYELFPLFKALFIETNPMPVKAALARMGLIENILRLPLTPMLPDKFPQLEKVLKQLGIV
jgi:hypothetical protein